MSWIDSEGRRLAVVHTPEGVWIGWPGRAKFFGRSAAEAPHSAAETRDVRAPMTGRLVKAPVTAGRPVAEGDLLFVLEAMKMEYRVLSPRAGIVRTVHVREGELVDLGRVLLDFEP